MIPKSERQNGSNLTIWSKLVPAARRNYNPDLTENFWGPISFRDWGLDLRRGSPCTFKSYTGRKV